jgi:hypothetical protein
MRTDTSTGNFKKLPSPSAASQHTSTSFFSSAAVKQSTSCSCAGSGVLDLSANLELGLCSLLLGLLLSGLLLRWVPRRATAALMRSLAWTLVFRR